MSKPSRKKPFIIGVAGGSGSGKTTVVENLLKVLGNLPVACISHDDYYRDQSHLSMNDRKKTNYDHPKALETELMVEQLQDLLKGKAIDKPTYDFIEHTRSKKIEKIKPAGVFIIEGILLFEDKALRDLFDLKVYVDTDPDIRLLRRIKRDIEHRGRSLEFVVDQYLKFTRPMHLEFVEPSKRHADVIIPEGGFNSVALDLLLARVRELLR